MIPCASCGDPFTPESNEERVCFVCWLRLYEDAQRLRALRRQFVREAEMARRIERLDDEGEWT